MNSKLIKEEVVPRVVIAGLSLALALAVAGLVAAAFQTVGIA